MSVRQSMATGMTPLLLRLVLGLTFLWAGLGKVMTTRQFSPEQSAMLANAGVIPAPEAAGVVPPIETAPVVVPPDAVDAPADIPADIPADAPAEAPVEIPDEAEPEAPVPADGIDEEQTAMPAAATIVLARQEARVYTADDFPAGLEMKSVYGIALQVAMGANPPMNPDTAQRRMPLVPEVFAGAPWPSVLAWAAALTELLAGAALLVGFLSRLSALSVAGVMLVAMWLTQIGPAIQFDTALLGFLPGPASADVSALEWVLTPGNWNNFLWQFALLFAAFGLFFAGPGWVSVDRLLFKPKPVVEDDEE